MTSVQLTPRPTPNSGEAKMLRSAAHFVSRIDQATGTLTVSSSVDGGSWTPARLSYSDCKYQPYLPKRSDDSETSFVENFDRYCTGCWNEGSHTVDVKLLQLYCRTATATSTTDVDTFVLQDAERVNFSKHMGYAIAQVKTDAGAYRVIAGKVNGNPAGMQAYEIRFPPLCPGRSLHLIDMAIDDSGAAAVVWCERSAGSADNYFMDCIVCCEPGVVQLSATPAHEWQFGRVSESKYPIRVAMLNKRVVVLFSDRSLRFYEIGSSSRSVPSRPQKPSRSKSRPKRSAAVGGGNGRNRETLATVESASSASSASSAMLTTLRVDPRDHPYTPYSDLPMKSNATDDDTQDVLWTSAPPLDRGRKVVGFQWIEEECIGDPLPHEALVAGFVMANQSWNSVIPHTWDLSAEFLAMDWACPLVKSKLTPSIPPMDRSNQILATAGMDGMVRCWQTAMSSVESPIVQLRQICKTPLVGVRHTHNIVVIAGFDLAPIPISNPPPQIKTPTKSPDDHKRSRPEAVVQFVCTYGAHAWVVPSTDARGFPLQPPSASGSHRYDANILSSSRPSDRPLIMRKSHDIASSQCTSYVLFASSAGARLWTPGVSRVGTGCSHAGFWGESGKNLIDQPVVHIAVPVDGRVVAFSTETGYIHFLEMKRGCTKSALTGESVDWNISEIAPWVNRSSLSFDMRLFSRSESAEGPVWTYVILANVNRKLIVGGLRHTPNGPSPRLKLLSQQEAAPMFNTDVPVAGDQVVLALTKDSKLCQQIEPGAQSAGTTSPSLAVTAVDDGNSRCKRLNGRIVEPVSSGPRPGVMAAGCCIVM